MVVRVESEVFQDELSSGDKGDSHWTVDDWGEDLIDRLVYGIGEHFSQGLLERRLDLVEVKTEKVQEILGDNHFLEDIW